MNRGFMISPSPVKPHLKKPKPKPKTIHTKARHEAEAGDLCEVKINLVYHIANSRSARTTTQRDPVSNKQKTDWRDGSVEWFQFSAPTRGLPAAWNASSGVPTPSSSPSVSCTHMIHRYSCELTHAHINLLKQQQKTIFKQFRCPKD